MAHTVQVDEKGRFIKGVAPWNKGKYGYMGANRTSFTSERINEIGRRSIGVGRVYSNQCICLTDERVLRRDPRHHGKSYMFRKRMSTARYVLREAGIEIPKNHVVWHKDRNPGNNAIENLEVISRGEMMKRNAVGRW